LIGFKSKIQPPNDDEHQESKN